MNGQSPELSGCWSDLGESKHRDIKSGQTPRGRATQGQGDTPEMKGSEEGREHPGGNSNLWKGSRARMKEQRRGGAETRETSALRSEGSENPQKRPGQGGYEATATGGENEP